MLFDYSHLNGQLNGYAHSSELNGDCFSVDYFHWRHLAHISASHIVHGKWTLGHQNTKTERPNKTTEENATADKELHTAQTVDCFVRGADGETVHFV